MDPTSPSQSNVPFQNIRIHYSDSKDTSAMHQLGDLFIVADVGTNDGGGSNGGGASVKTSPFNAESGTFAGANASVPTITGTLVSPIRPFQFVNTVNPKVPPAAASEFVKNSHQITHTEKDKGAADDGGAVPIEASPTYAAALQVDAQRQAARDAELKHCKVLADGALKEMLLLGHSLVSPYTLRYTSYAYTCDACGKSYTESDAQSNGFTCHSCVCCPDCHTVLEPTMNAETKVAWVQCRACHWRSEPQKDVNDLNAYLSDMRLWGGQHETSMRRGAAVARRFNREFQKEISVSNEVIAERDRALGRGYGGQISIDGGATTQLLTPAGLMGDASSSVSSPTKNAEDGGGKGGSTTEFPASSAASSPAPEEVAAYSVDLQPHKKHLARSQRVLQYDRLHQLKTTEMLAKHSTNFDPTVTSADKCPVNLANIGGKKWYQPGGGRGGNNNQHNNNNMLDITGTQIIVVTDENNKQVNNKATSEEESQQRPGGESILAIADFMGGGSSSADDWEGPKPQPRWSATLLKVRAAGAANVSGTNAIAHAIASSKAMLNADSMGCFAVNNNNSSDANTNKKAAASSSSALHNNFNRLLRQGDTVGRTRWIRHAPLAARHAVIHPFSTVYGGGGSNAFAPSSSSPSSSALALSSLCYVPTSDKVLESASVSSFVSGKRSEALANNTNAGRFLPFLRVAATKLSPEYMAAQEVKNAALYDNTSTKKNKKSFKRVFCYLWNYGETDVKVTNLRVVGTNGFKKGATVTCSYEAAMRRRAIEAAEEDQKRMFMISEVEEDEELLTDAAMAEEAKQSTTTRQPTSAGCGDDSFNNNNTSGINEGGGGGGDDGGGLKSLDGTINNLDQTVGAINTSNNNIHNKSGGDDGSNPLSADDHDVSEKIATPSHAEEESTATAVTQPAAPPPPHRHPHHVRKQTAEGTSELTPTSKDGGGAVAAADDESNPSAYTSFKNVGKKSDGGGRTTRQFDAGLLSSLIGGNGFFLESREKDLETSLNTSTVVTDKVAKEIAPIAIGEVAVPMHVTPPPSADDSHMMNNDSVVISAEDAASDVTFFKCEGSRALFYIDVVEDVEDALQLNGTTRMIALQISAIANLKKAKVNINYNAYLTFE